MPPADIAIIGGGAAGLTAAIFAAQSAPPSARVIILDGAPRLGAKILVSGGGRCNVTSHAVTPDDYNAASRNIVRNVLASFDQPATIAWFASLGVELKREETGKLFPTTDSARTVLDALLRRCAQLNVTIETNAKVTTITAPSPETDDAFQITHTRGQLAAHRLILSPGGQSLPKTGSDGSGWQLARSLGHTVTPTHAALVPLVLDANKSFHASLSGISHDAELSTFVAGKLADRRAGSLLWTHFGITGPVVMDASRFWVIAHESQPSRGTRPPTPHREAERSTDAHPPAPPQLLLNFLPNESFDSADRWLTTQSTSRPRATLVTTLTTRLPERVAAALLQHVSVDPTTPLAQLPRDARRTLARALTAFPLPVTQHRGWNYAEVTAGGVPLSEINYRTMESRKTPRLHLAGEILDCDGRIGGFNFQWAWSTGHLAGTAAARSVHEHTAPSQPPSQ